MNVRRDLKPNEDIELGRLALLLAAVGLALVGMTLRGSLQADSVDAPFPAIVEAPAIATR